MRLVVVDKDGRTIGAVELEKYRWRWVIPNFSLELETSEKLYLFTILKREGQTLWGQVIYKKHKGGGL
jgi:hypothetical protein